MSDGAGNLSTAVSLLAGGTATFSVPATVAADAPESIVNTAIATVPNGTTDPAPANNRATDVDEAVPPQSLAVEIRAGDPAVVGPAAFEVPYSIDVRNTGPNPLTNLQVSDSLSSAFARDRDTIERPQRQDEAVNRRRRRLSIPESRRWPRWESSASGGAIQIGSRRL